MRISEKNIQKNGKPTGLFLFAVISVLALANLSNVFASENE